MLNSRSITNKLITQLKEKQLTLAFAESITCGLAAHILSNVKGVSDVLMGAVICYHPTVKSNLIKVNKKIMDKYTCESVQVTKALAHNLVKLINADIHVAVTGLASAGGSETKTKPVGTVFISINYKSKIYNFEHRFNGSPLEIKKKACIEMYKQVIGIIK